MIVTVPEMIELFLDIFELIVIFWISKELNEEDKQ